MGTTQLGQWGNSPPNAQDQRPAQRVRCIAMLDVITAAACEPIGRELGRLSETFTGELFIRGEVSDNPCPIDSGVQVDEPIEHGYAMRALGSPSRDADRLAKYPISEEGVQPTSLEPNHRLLTTQHHSSTN
jgi:hypothetical protein